MAVFPYFEARQFSVLGLTVHTFALLVGAAMLTGFLLAAQRGRRYGISRERIALFSVFLLAGGLFGARFGRVFYQPDLLRQALTDPRTLLQNLHGISSFGAYFGGLAAALLFFRLHCQSIRERLQFLDAVGFALPFSWCLGRIGCALVHDHPGILSSGWFTVAYPDGPRYDLGLLEALFLFLIGFLFLFLDRRKRPAGFYFACYFTLYGPFRFLLDQLHVDPPRYAGWTVDQFGAALALAAAVIAWLFISRSSSHSSLETSCALPYRSISQA